MGPIANDTNTALALEAKQVRAALGRPGPLVDLFDFLLARSLSGAPPREIEIAQDVFGKTAEYDMAQDASVRVYVHRLRRKIGEYYAGTDGPRLSLPKGEYRLVLHSNATPPEPSPQTTGAAGRFSALRTFARTRWRWGAGAVVFAANLVAWLLVYAARPNDANEAIAKSVFWHQLSGNGRPTSVVTGDYYIYGEAPDGTVTRLVRDFSVNSREDLDQYLMDHPAERGHRVDVNLHYLPTSTARALGDLLPVIYKAAIATGGRLWVLTGSELPPDTLKGVNIVYIGFFSGLGILRDPVFAASGFAVGASYDELIDRISGKRFTSDWGNITDNHAQHRDYAYLASFSGASGNRILIVAGTRDAGVMQAAEVASDQTQLDQLARATGKQGSFEALYEVHTLGNVNLGSKLVLARPLRPGQPFKPGQDDATFPDQTPASGPPAR